jgi:hypothetical protein
MISFQFGVRSLEFKTKTNALNPLTCHCEPEGRDNLVFQGIASSPP